MGLVTAVIVDFRRAQLVARGVASLLGQSCPQLADVVIVDNSVSSANAERLRSLERPNVTVLLSSANVGYTVACNAGAALARGDYLLFLNPDIQWNEPGALRRMIAFMDEHPSIAITGPRQQNEDGSAAFTARQFPTIGAQVLRRTRWRGVPPFSRMVASYEATNIDYTRSQQVAWLQSSCMLVRRAFWEQVGGFDSRYFLFMADVDLCRQAWRAGWEVWLHADSAVTANGHRASAGGALDLFRSAPLRRHVVDAGRYYLKVIRCERSAPMFRPGLPPGRIEGSGCSSVAWRPARSRWRRSTSRSLR